MFCFKGDKIGVGIYGASHSEKIGVVMQNFPAEKIDVPQLCEFLARRKASGGVFSTARKEDDTPVFESGVENDAIVSNTVEVAIYNKNVRSGDYSNLYGKPRPSHADFSAHCMDGRLDFSGGGEFSGRMTAPFAIAGGIAKQMLKKRGVEVFAYVASVGKVNGKSYKDDNFDLNDLHTSEFPSLSNGDEMLKSIAQAKKDGNSIGGIVECVVNGMPAGVGGALFEGLESKIAYLIYAIPAVKGVEFGDGFDLSRMCGSDANDAWTYVDGDVVSLTNRAGGINGGVSNGMPITLSVAFRPTPSIALEQQTVDLVNKTNTTIKVGGRHDACIVPRAVAVVESAVAIALLDSILKTENI